VSTDELIFEIEEILKKSGDFGEMYKTMESFRDSGGKQEVATQALSKLVDKIRDARNGEDSEEEDLVLDLLDYVSGWCSPSKDIWKSKNSK